MEMCAGCGAIAAQHPIIGVARDPEVGQYRGYPVCKECHEDPQHRKNPLKMHYFERGIDDINRAIRMAGSARIG